MPKKNFFSVMLERVADFFAPKRKASLLMSLLVDHSETLSDTQLVAYAKKIPYIVSAVNLISNSIANLPFKYNNTKTQELMERPNSKQSQMQFLQELVSDLLYFGNAYVYLNVVGSRRLKELVLLEPYLVKLNIDEYGDVISYEYGNKNKETYNPEQIIHIKLPDPLNPNLGFSPIRSLEFTIQQYIYTKQWNANLMKNGARPSGALTTDETLTEEQFNRLKAQITQEFSGAVNSGKPLLLEGGLKWQEFTVSPKELDWLTSLKSLIKEIAIAFGIAPELLGDSENKTYSNFQEARKQLYYNVVLPYAETIIYELNRALTKYLNFYVEIDYKNIDALAEDKDSVIKQATEGVTKGVMTINEGRKLLGLPPIKGGDQIFMNASLMPMLAGFEELETEELQ